MHQKDGVNDDDFEPYISGQTNQVTYQKIIIHNMVHVSEPLRTILIILTIPTSYYRKKLLNMLGVSHKTYEYSTSNLTMIYLFVS